MKNFPKCKEKGSFPKSKIKSLLHLHSKLMEHINVLEGADGVFGLLVEGRLRAGKPQTWPVIHQPATCQDPRRLYPCAI